MKRATVASALAPVLVLALAAGCSEVTAGREPLTPVSYEAPGFRAPESVGRLAELAVYTVALDWEADRAVRREPAFRERFDRVRDETRSTLAAYLALRKGYDVVPVDEPPPAAKPAAIREAGRQHGADGVVIVERWVAEPWDSVDGVVNIMLLNIPLARALSEVSLRVSIYETATGRLAWQAVQKGRDDAGGPIEWARLLGDMDNAVPRQLRR